MNYSEAFSMLDGFGQAHVLTGYDQLSDREQNQLIDQIELTDFNVLKTLACKGQPVAKGQITPINVMSLDKIASNQESYRKIGTEALLHGKVGAVVLAGGMGTRLGSEDPKGVYNIGLTKEVYIFQRLIENLTDVIHEISDNANDGRMHWIHFFIMTSDKNHEKTVSFLKEHNYFGYAKEYIHFFKQQMAPAVNYDGKLLMDSPASISNSPNGNGGWYASIYRTGLNRIIEENGIEWLNVFNVDNVLQRIADPCFIGATIANNCSVGSKVVKKANLHERVGAMCLEDGKPSIVEYFDMSEELLKAKDENGDPAYNYGVILNLLFSIKELDRIANEALPVHLVEKVIPYMNDEGVLITPEKPNGYKFEILIVDMIRLMNNCLPYEVVREREFAPIKNASGADSVETARELCKKNGIEL